MIIRDARSADVAAMLAIYAPIVETTAISFEASAPSPGEFAARVDKYGNGWAWLVAEDGGELLGYAYGSPHRERAAYRWSVETSAYVAAAARGRGVGQQLYRALLARLAQRGYCNAYAGIALPNAASIGLHESVGFRAIGAFPSVGYKLGRWHDVAWYHQALRAAPAAPEAPA
ncbi:arsinothricin resistance N-acetyltransferase ArsN1 family B [Solimonas marina]|uniref:N-acetyltransferase n=1 Tax=Solimonas marina TaxID=2714601 RepID=A0A970B4R9_9GAMM|nr:arsinothricin resistance N-acetyltransferase ArsN1 family B [Solimonas marina]NKF22612.1 N-acetyltransferase [Solimonas marina]